MASNTPPREGRVVHFRDGKSVAPMSVKKRLPSHCAGTKSTMPMNSATNLLRGR